MTVFNGYPLSILLAVLLHALIVGAVLWMERASTESALTIQPPSVKAVLVEENPQARNERVQEQQRREEAEAQRQAELEAQRERERQQAEAEAQRQRELEEQRRREEQRQQELAEQRERERQAEAERQRQEEAAQRRREEEARRQAEQAAQRAAEQAAAEAARQQAASDAERVAGYTAVIHDLVQQNWSRPPSARNGMTAVLRIRLVPTGEVIDVEVVQSSGDAAFDRAAENAVYAVGRFSELQGMPPRLFERNFRSLLLTFRPEDLRN